MAKQTLYIRGTLPINPISLACPSCEAMPGLDCATSSGGFSVVHVSRINAALSDPRGRKPCTGRTAVISMQASDGTPPPLRCQIN
jgi:hypothetical protein